MAGLESLIANNHDWGGVQHKPEKQGKDHDAQNENDYPSGFHRVNPFSFTIAGF